MANTPFEAPIPGQAWTEQPGSMPYDRPPQFADVEEALDYVFRKLMEPETVMNTLTLIESGMPLETLANALCMSGFVEGKWSAPMVMLMVNPVVIMLAKMAKAAEIPFTVSSGDKNKGKPTEAMVRAAHSKITEQQAAKAEKVLASQETGKGLMTPTAPLATTGIQ